MPSVQVNLELEAITTTVKRNCCKGLPNCKHYQKGKCTIRMMGGPLMQDLDVCEQNKRLKCPRNVRGDNVRAFDEESLLRPRRR